MSNKNLGADEDAGCCAGVIFYQMLYGKKPFGEDQSQEMYAPSPNRLPPLLLCKMFATKCPSVLTKSGGVQDSLAADDPQGVPAVPDGPEGVGRVEGIHRALPLAGPEQPTHRHAGALLHNRLG